MPSKLKRAVDGGVRLALVTMDAYFRERTQPRAAALSFYTMLSLVPMAALVFSIAKGVGLYDVVVSDHVRPYLDSIFASDPAVEPPPGVVLLQQAIGSVLDLVARTDVFGLGVVGLVVLVITISRVTRLAERSFDAIWGFPPERGLARRVAGHVLVAVVTPILLTFASTVTAARQEQVVLAWLGRSLGSLPVQALALASPPFLVVLGIFPLYVALPGGRVSRSSALIGALIGGLGWYALQVVHVRFQIGVARQNALYSGFGAIPIFAIWLYFSWLWVLLGAHVAAFYQRARTDGRDADARRLFGT